MVRRPGRRTAGKTTVSMTPVTTSGLVAGQEVGAVHEDARQRGIEDVEVEALAEVAAIGGAIPDASHHRNAGADHVAAEARLHGAPSRGR